MSVGFLTKGTSMYQNSMPFGYYVDGDSTVIEWRVAPLQKTEAAHVSA
jgi:hypothetical protein